MILNYLTVMIIAGSISSLVLGYLVKYKKMYGLITDINFRSKEEQEELVKNGYPQAIGQLLINSGLIVMGAKFIRVLPIPYGIEIGIFICIIYMVAALLYYHTKLKIR